MRPAERVRPLATAAGAGLLALALAGALAAGACGGGSAAGADGAGADADAAAPDGSDGGGDTAAADAAPDAPADTAPDDGGGAPDTAPDPGPADTAPEVGPDVPPADTGPDGPDVNPACPLGEPCPLGVTGLCQQGICNALGQCVAVAIPGCCTSDDDCADEPPSGPCEVFRCLAQQCVPVQRPGCCATDAACDDGAACTVDTCSGPGGRCTSCPVTCPCPLQAPLLSVGFDADQLASLGFSQVDEQPLDDVRWQTDTQRWVSPPRAAYAGNPACHTYYSGGLTDDCQPASPLQTDSDAVRIGLWSPVVSLPAASAGGHVALFWLWADVEPLSTGGPGERDVVRVEVDEVFSGQLWPAVTSTVVGKDTQGQWRLVAVDLAPWAGTSVRLRFTFDTLDGAQNLHEGVYLDDLQVVARCQGGCCETDADCAGLASPDPCRAPRCVALSDGGGPVCAVVEDTPDLPCEPCEADADCADDNPCTEDTCGPAGTCERVAFCCYEVTAGAEGFEGGLVGWFVQDEQPEDDVTWRTAEDPSVQGLRAAWLGDPATGTYAAPGPVRATMTSGVTSVPTAGGQGALVGLSFWLRLSTEWDGQLYDNPAGLDRLSVAILSAGKLTEVWSSDEVGGSTGGLWVPVTVDLAAWAGKPVQLRVTFDTVDESANDFAGPFLDQLELGVFCPGPP